MKKDYQEINITTEAESYNATTKRKIGGQMALTTKRKIHKAVIYAMFTILFIVAGLNVINTHWWDNDLVDKWTRTIGTIVETPMLALMLLYMYRYFKIKKNETNRTNQIHHNMDRRLARNMYLMGDTNSKERR